MRFVRTRTRAQRLDLHGFSDPSTPLARALAEAAATRSYNEARSPKGKGGGGSASAAAATAAAAAGGDSVSSSGGGECDGGEDGGHGRKVQRLLTLDEEDEERAKLEAEEAVAQAAAIMAAHPPVRDTGALKQAQISSIFEAYRLHEHFPLACTEYFLNFLLVQACTVPRVGVHIYSSTVRM